MRPSALMKSPLTLIEKEFRYLQNSVQNATELIDISVHKASLIM